MALDYDALVIGSGFGGAVAACRLSEAGYRVLVLERGRRWAREDYPSLSGSGLIWDEGNPANSNGWFDFRFFDSIATIAGAGVGGGSLHYANVSIDAREDLFEEGWPDEISFQELKDVYYPRVAQVLPSAKIPANQYSNRTKLLQQAAQAAGFGKQFSEVALAVRFNREFAYDASQEPDPDLTEYEENAEGIRQGFCVHLGQCVLGCPVEARNTLALNYIPRAEKAGAEVRPLHLVRRVEPAEGGYRVHFDRIHDGRLTRGYVTGRIVVVAAGSVGSSELLLRSRDQYRTLPRIGPRLGEKWSSNANYLTLAIHKNYDVFPTRGPTISASIEFLGRYSFKGSKFYIEDGGVSDVLEDNLDSLRQPGGQASRFAEALRAVYENLNREPLQHLMLWFAQGRDQPSGKFLLKRPFPSLGGPKTEFELKWDRQGARKVLDAIQEIHRILADKTDGKIFFQPTDALITPHPLGGCPMGNSVEDGVVDHRGEVFGYRNLYVADGAIIPRPVGHNPSKTIAALSERISELIVQEGR